MSCAPGTLPHASAAMLLGVRPRPWKRPHRNQHVHVYSSFIQNRQIAKVTKVSSSRCTDKRTGPSGRRSVLCCRKGRSFRAMRRHGGTLNAGGRVTDARLRRRRAVIPTRRRSGKGDAVAAVTSSVSAGGWPGGAGEQAEHGGNTPRFHDGECTS